MSGLFGIGADALFTGGMGLLGGLLTNAQNAEIAEANRDFAERMYKHRYTWAMRDLEYAGLNPILAGIAGQSTASAPGAPEAVNAIGQGINAANQTAQIASTQKLNSAQEAKASAEAAVASQEAAAQAERNKVLPEKLKNELTQQAFTNSAIAGENAIRSAQYTKLWTEIELNRIQRDSSLPPNLKQKIELYKDMFPMMPGKVAGAVSGLLRSGAVAGTAAQQGNLRKGLSDYLQSQRKNDYWKLYSKTPGYQRYDGVYINSGDSRRWQDYVDAQYN